LSAFALSRSALTPELPGKGPLEPRSMQNSLCCPWSRDRDRDPAQTQDLRPSVRGANREGPDCLRCSAARHQCGCLACSAARA
jgi:hypothetical protein